MIARLRCWWRSFHDPGPARVNGVGVGGFRCKDCGAPGADLDDLGYHGNGYVSPLRKIYERDKGVTRTSAWEPGRRGW